MMNALTNAIARGFRILFGPRATAAKRNLVESQPNAAATSFIIGGSSSNA